MVKKSYGIKTVDVQCGDAKCSFYNIYREDADRSARKMESFHAHKYYECHLVESGIYTLETEHEKIQVAGKNLVVVPPGKGHFTAECREGFREYVLAFSLENVKNDKQGFFAIFKYLLETSAMRPIAISEKLLQKVAKIQEMPIPVTAEEYCHCMSVATEGMALLFSEINRRAESNVFNAGISTKEDFHILLDLYVSDREYSMEDIAEKLGYSPRHLARLIHNVYGMSLADLRKKKRCEDAKRLLRYTDSSMERIAEDVGFNSPAAMRETFRRYEGITPAEYRKKYKG